MNVRGKEIAPAFRFAAGESLDHIDGGMQGFISERARMEGGEGYVIWCTYDDDDGRYAFVLGAEVVPLA